MPTRAFRPATGGDPSSRRRGWGKTKAKPNRASKAPAAPVSRRRNPLLRLAGETVERRAIGMSSLAAVRWPRLAPIT